MKQFEILWKYWNVKEVSKGCWKNGADKLVQHRVATGLQFVKNTLSAKHNKAKCDKTRYTYIDKISAFWNILAVVRFILL